MNCLYGGWGEGLRLKLPLDRLSVCCRAKIKRLILLQSSLSLLLFFLRHVVCVAFSLCALFLCHRSVCVGKWTLLWVYAGQEEVLKKGLGTSLRSIEWDLVKETLVPYRLSTGIPRANDIFVNCIRSNRQHNLPPP